MSGSTTSGIDNADLPTVDITPLPTAMSAAAFLGIAWYLCAELNIRLLIRASRRRSLYFWSCLACSWGIILHSIIITLTDFKVWTGSYGSIVLILLTWCTYVVAQSFVLYSRLNLVLKNENIGRYVLIMILANSIIFGGGTVILSLIARHPGMINRLSRVNLIWDKVQLSVFFAQETLIGLLYIRDTAAHLKNMTLLGTNKKTIRRNLRHLIVVNIFIIILDCSLIGLCFAGYFFLQGFYKVAVYAIKLRTEFTILNQLRSSLPSASTHESDYVSDSRQFPRTTNGARGRQESQDSDMEMVMMASQIREIHVQKDVIVSSTRREDNESIETTNPS
ncbi:Nn.00g117110.m01.CDS01 [Neocucurbitaria sp. VM-36]